MCPRSRCRHLAHAWRGGYRQGGPAHRRTRERTLNHAEDQAVAEAAAKAKVAADAAKAEADQQVVKAREALRDQVAVLAVKGAEQILRKEVNAGVHADLLGRLKTEL